MTIKKKGEKGEAAKRETVERETVERESVKKGSVKGGKAKRETARGAGRRVAAWCVAFTLAALGASVPSPALAQPEFAHTPEEWEKLRDNTLEYGELSDLIHEYNITVKNNRISYNSNKNNDSTDMSEALSEAASDLYDSAGEMETMVDNTPGIMMAPGGAYANMIYGAKMLEYNARSLQKQADSNTVDAHMMKVQYDMQESGLVMTAQTYMNSLQQLESNREILEDTLELLNASYEAALAQREQGLATDIEVLKAEQSIQTTESSLTNLESNQKKLRQNLCLLTGWDYNGQPDIAAITESDIDITRLEEMDPEADLEEALGNNYMLRYYQMQLDNTSETSKRDSVKNTIEETRQQVGATLKTLYLTAQDKKSSYELSKAEYALAQTDLESARLRYELGNSAKLEYLQAKNGNVQKKAAEETSRLELLQAIETYEWAVKGLTAQGN